ncbi:MAG TPA: hypothetical protein VGY48_33935 [Vicinamibacterales bacterium]|jgi:seryl-tRNA synthetase|nr:hypothetical protein [Vicinamibacterales bacterium]
MRTYPGWRGRALVAYSTCFRREAGAAGKDTRGMFRVSNTTDFQARQADGSIAVPRVLLEFGAPPRMGSNKIAR